MTETFIRLFGAVQVERENAPVGGFESEKALALLGYLILQQRPVTRKHLAAHFWGTKSESRALSNLRRVLHHFTHALPECFRVTRQTVEFLPSPHCQTDVARFEEALHSRDPRALAAGLALYRADLMEGIALDDCPEFEIWLLGERERWKQHALQALKTLTAHHLQRGEYQEGLRYATRIVALAPWEEEGHRQLMRLLAKSGQRAAALTQYERCRRILHEELGVAPSAETRALYERIRYSPAPRHNLPAEPTPFVGRKAELAEIAQRLAAPQSRLITVVGIGGVGKTRLAVQAARAARHAFLHGVFFVPLARAEHPETLPMHIAQAIGLPLRGAAPPQTQLLGYLRDKEMLLVLDNMEHLLTPHHAAPTLALLNEILTRAPHVKILATSREALRSRWEWVLPLRGLPTATAAGETSEAEALFVQTAQRADARFDAQQEAPAVARICQMLEGLPLGVEIAAAWTPTLSCQQIAERLTHNMAALQARTRDYPARHASLRALCDASWQLLSVEEQSVFPRLAVFAGSFRAEAAHAVAQAAPATLARLTERNLLRRTADGRYSLHPVLKDYAATRLSAAQEEAAVWARFRTYYAGVLAALEDALESPRQKQALETIAADMDNFEAMWESALQTQDFAALQQAAHSLYAYHEIRSGYAQGEALFRAAKTALEAHATQRPLLFAEILAHWGWFLHRTGQNQAAAEALARSRDIFARHHAEEALAFTLVRLGDTARALGDYTKAAGFLQEGLARFRALGNRGGIARALNTLGILASIRGEHSTARAHLEESLALHRQLGDPFGTALALNNLGIVLDESGQPQAAQSLYLESLHIREDLGDAYGMAAALGNLGIVADIQGHAAEARQYFTRGIAIAREFNYRSMIAGFLNNLAMLDTREGRYADAASRLQESLRLAVESGDKRRQALTLLRLGHAQAANNAPRRARQRFAEALALTQELQIVPLVLESLLGLVSLGRGANSARQRLEVLTFIANHPARTQDSESTLRDLQAEAESHLTEAERQQARANAQRLTLETATAAALALPAAA